MEYLYEKYGKKKIYIGTAILLVIINIITVFTLYQANISFTIDGQKFKYISEDENTILFRDREENLVTITIEDENINFPAYVTIIADKYQIEYKDKIIKVDYSNWMSEEGRGIITLSDGSEYKQGITINFGEKNQHGEPPHFDMQLVRNLNSAYDVANSEYYSVFILTIPLILLGLAEIMYPEKMWRFSHRLHVRGGEPTEWAIFSNKLGGVIMIGMALLLPFIVYRKI